MRPEFPFLAAGAISLAAGAKRERGFPSNGMTAVIATVALVIIASATAGSRSAPIVRAFGMIALLATVMAAIPTFSNNRRRESNG